MLGLVDPNVLPRELDTARRFGSIVYYLVH
jgi:hypothetical protein